MVRNALLEKMFPRISRKSSPPLSAKPGSLLELLPAGSLQRDLTFALDNNALTLAFQPIVSLADGRIVAVEALLRWSHPDLGPQPPAVFIPAAEKMGLIVPISEWVIEEACRVAAKFPANIVFSINLSPIQLATESLITTVAAALEVNELAGHRIEFEVTETAELVPDQRTLQNLYQLKDLGCSISLDDFGSGFCRLEAIRSFAFDLIKVDRSIVSRLDLDNRALWILETIVFLGQQMNIKVLAEGIENERQAKIAQTSGCTLGQGYFYARPMLEHHLSDLLKHKGPVLSPMLEMKPS
jgi:EAL domain-containing protein (putative c-di-GMP-specific phosphodiesterase class I)